MNVLFVIILFGLMHAFRSFSTAGVAASAGTSLAMGYLLLTAYFAGKTFAQLRLPKLTGYIVAGIAVGPAGLNLVTEPMVDSLKLVNGMAVALIALTAGAELELRAMRPLFRAIRWVSLTAVLGTAVLLTLAVFLIRRWLPFMAELSLAQAALVSAVLGVVMVAQSPAVVMALRSELAADGPVARLVLGVVVIADLLVILLFAATSSATKALFGGRADTLSTLGTLAWELLGSLLVGAAIGAILSLYLQKVREGAAIFLLTIAFIVAEVGQRLHFDPLLVTLAAGAWIRNMTPAGDDVHHLVEGSALPIYVLFFAVAGATIHLDALAVVGAPALFFIVVRGVGLIVGTRIGARMAGADERVARYAGFGLLPQAGLALALSMLFAKTFPEFGAEAAALTLTVVAINELLAPAMYRYALIRSGEAYRRAAEQPAAESAAAASETTAEPEGSESPPVTG